MARAAAILSLISALAHLGIGTFDALYLSLAPNVPLAAVGPVIVTWYLLGLFMIWSAWSFWSYPNTHRSLGTVWVLSGLIFIVFGLAKDGLTGLVALPQWTILAAAGVCGIVASQRR